MDKTHDLTQGNILKTLVRFALPVLLALVLQALYGAVDLWVVGRFALTEDASGVATGSMLTQTITMAVTGLAMGITVLVGETIGQGRSERAGRAIGGGIWLFAVLSALLTALLTALAGPLVRLMDAPEEAFHQAVQYVRICGAGSVFIVAYNVLGSVFRGIGDSKTPLLTVAIACGINIAGDLLFVAGCGMGAAGAALATVAAQAASVVISLLLIRRRTLPFTFSPALIRADWPVIRKELRLGWPIALSLGVGAVMFYVTFFHGDLLASVFIRDAAVIAEAHSYLKAYAIDCLLTAVMFCMIGYFNGREQTFFVMVQGLVGALLVRTPAAWLFSRTAGVTLFRIGLATPMSSAVQIVMCLIMYVALEKRKAEENGLF